MEVQANVDAIQTEDVSQESVAAIKSNRELAMEQIELANLRRMEEDTGVKLVDDSSEEAPVVCRERPCRGTGACRARGEGGSRKSGR
mgnify:CR=1 FL=1